MVVSLFKREKIAIKHDLTSTPNTIRVAVSMMFNLNPKKVRVRLLNNRAKVLPYKDEDAVNPYEATQVELVVFVFVLLLLESVFVVGGSSNSR
jgi:hypothetical protein